MNVYSKFNPSRYNSIAIQTDHNESMPEIHSPLKSQSYDKNPQSNNKQSALVQQFKQSLFDDFNNRELINMNKEYQEKTRYKSRLNQIDHRLKNIMERYERKKQKIHHLKIEKQNQNYGEFLKYKFSPKIRHNPRYAINSNIQQRNKSWDEARAKHYTSIREEVVEKQVKECTFQPNLITKQKNRELLQNRMMKKQKQKYRKEKMEATDKFIKINSRKLNIDELKIVKKYGSNSYSYIRLLIKEEMNKIDFLY